MAKRFRKVYIVCEDNQIFNNLAEIRIYKYRDTAEFACRRAQDKTDAEEQKIWNMSKPRPVFKVHAFFLVHEDMFRD